MKQLSLSGQSFSDALRGLATAGLPVVLMVLGEEEEDAASLVAWSALARIYAHVLVLAVVKARRLRGAERRALLTSDDTYLPGGGEGGARERRLACDDAGGGGGGEGGGGGVLHAATRVVALCRGGGGGGGGGGGVGGVFVVAARYEGDVTASAALAVWLAEVLTYADVC